MKNMINIALATDDNYLPLAVVALESLFDTNDCEFHIHLLANNISKNRLDAFRDSLPNNRCELSIYPMENLRGMLGIDVPPTISIVSYARLFLPSILPTTVDKVLYIDCDIMFNGNIQDFYNTELDNALVAGVHDLLLGKAYKKLVSIPQEEPYFNAGILLIPLDTWRREGMQQKFLDYLLSHNGTVYHHDQGIINAVCAGRKKVVLPRYNTISNYFYYPYKYMSRHTPNFYTEDQYKTATEQPAIIHFTGIIPGRPWEEGCTHPYKDNYIYYQNKTSYGNAPLKPRHLSNLDVLEIWAYRFLPFGCYALIVKSILWVSYLKRKGK